MASIYFTAGEVGSERMGTGALERISECVIPCALILEAATPVGLTTEGRNSCSHFKSAGSWRVSGVQKRGEGDEDKLSESKYR